jgi:uncharacterized membrane protein YheB (UPF0754 family)
MSTLEFKLVLPDSLAREAAVSGLLTPESIEALLRAEICRRRVKNLFAAADRLAISEARLTEEEIEAEIAAVRQSRRSPPST